MAKTVLETLCGMSNKKWKEKCHIIVILLSCPYPLRTVSRKEELNGMENIKNTYYLIVIYLYLFSFINLHFNVFLLTRVICTFYVWRNNFLHSYFMLIHNSLLSLFIFSLLRERGKEIDAWMMVKHVLCKWMKRCEPIHCLCFLLDIWVVKIIILMTKEYTLYLYFFHVISMSAIIF